LAAWADNPAPPHFKKDIFMKTYLCIVCGFVYDEAVGRPEDGIAAGTLWADVPAAWECPECGVAKADFEVVEV
jgi:rubredoxin